MTDVIELMSKAHGKAYDEYWAKHWVRGEPPGFGKVANDAHEFGMRAAIAALADNVSDEMVHSFAFSVGATKGEVLSIDATETDAMRQGISGAIRSLLQNE